MKNILKFKNIILFLMIIFIIFFIKLYSNLTKISSLNVYQDPFDKVEVQDRYGEKLLITYKTKWNVSNYVDLNKIPDFVKQVFVFVEDKRFFSHHGVDLRAKLGAILKSIKLGKVSRGASTISEQTIKIFNYNKRKRNLYTKLLEAIESAILETKFSKNEILEFYLNEVPYSRNIRGIKQASYYFFGRSLGTLSKKEIIALSIMLRSPSTLDPKKSKEKLEDLIEVYSKALLKEKIISELDYKHIKEEKLTLKEFILGTDASHFISFIKKQEGINNAIRNGGIKTTLDSSLQNEVKKILDKDLEKLKEKNVKNGGVLIVDLKENEILSWVVGGDIENEEDGKIDAITILRQPGSTLKPFLYARALEKGWTASTVIEDAPVLEEIDGGVHRYKNFGGDFYERLRLREALANSLNTPAVRGVKFVGVKDFLETLKSLGFHHLKRDSKFYGAGLVLGNAEVTLYELARAYSVLARRGVYKDFGFIYKEKEDFNNFKENENKKRVLDEDAADIINDILQDEDARRLEFGYSFDYKFTYPTSFKTGTSSDFRDAWVVAYTQDYLVAVWMGNYDRTPMKRVSGSVGPVKVMKSIFSLLNVKRGIKKNFNLERIAICPVTGLLAGKNCAHVDEIFKPGTAPKDTCDGDHEFKEKLYDNLKIAYPLNNTNFKIDKNESIDMQGIIFTIYPLSEKTKVYWWVDGKNVGESNERNGEFLWEPQKGIHKLQAVIYKNSSPIYSKEYKFKVW